MRAVPDGRKQQNEAGLYGHVTSPSSADIGGQFSVPLSGTSIRVSSYLRRQLRPVCHLNARMAFLLKRKRKVEATLKKDRPAPSSGPLPAKATEEAYGLFEFDEGTPSDALFE